MANLVSRATGNFTATTTWKTVETGTRAIQNAFSASTTTTTSNVFNADAQDFTIANLSVIEGILLYCNRTTTTGTVTVTLSQDSGTSNTRQVTVNASDLPLFPSWVFFEFGSTLTGDGGTDYAIAIQGSSAGNATFFRDATAANWTHLIVTDQNPGSVAAGDVFYVVGENISAGTSNTFTVTMDSTATTDYGTGTDGTSVNGIEIGNLGVLSYGTSAATNYYLKLSGSLNIWGGGTFNIGTSGAEIPRTSTAVLEFDPVADGGMGLYCRSGGIFNSYGLSRTSGKDIYYCLLNTNEAVNSTSLGVDTDTGWLDNDDIAIASTDRTAVNSERGLLNGAAGASTLTVDGFAGAGGGLAFAHSGTSPTQAEVILLTRNVIIRSATSTIMTFFYTGAGGVSTVRWTQFRYLGANLTDKRGIEVATTSAASGSFNMQYSSLWDTENWGFYQLTGTDNVTFNNNVSYNINTAAGASIYCFELGTSAGITGTNCFFQNNVIIRNNTSASGFGVVVRDPEVYTFTGNRIAGQVGTTSHGVFFGDVGSVGVETTGFINNNIVHSCAGYGIGLTAGNSGYYHQNWKVWRNGSGGIVIGSATAGQTPNNIWFENLEIFGNATRNVYVFTVATANVTFSNSTFNGETSFATTTGVEFLGATGSGSLAEMTFLSCKFSEVTGTKTAHTSDFDTTVANCLYRLTMVNTLLNGTNEFNSGDIPANIRVGSYISQQKHDQTSGNNRTQYKYGLMSIDTTIFDTTPSIRMTPNNATAYMQQTIGVVNVNSGQAVTPSVKVRESVVGDGTDYNGSRVRLYVKRNDAIGITSDTLLATATISSEGAWETLTGTTATASEDGVMEFYVDCRGTTGWVNVDTLTVTVS